MKKRTFYILSSVLFIIYLLISFLINRASIDGFVGKNDMFGAFDEIYSIREVYNIINAESLKELALSIIAGKGYIYGRFIYLINAIICFIPFKLFGLNGLVFTMRMAQSIYLFAGFVLISKYVCTSYRARIYSLIVLMILPVAIYFIGMPKPEPLQLMLLGLFFNSHKKYNWAWLFLGLAFGSKISIAFGVAVIGLFLLFSHFQEKKPFTILLNKIFWAITGLLIALPGLLFAPFFPYIRNGLINIFTTTTKPYDDPSITFMDWVHKLFTYYYELPATLSYTLMIILFSAALYLFVKERKYRSYILFAVFCLLPIMLLTKRLWGHYLFLGVAMFVPAMFEGISKTKIKLASLISLVVFLVFCVNTISVGNTIIMAKNRNQTPLFLATKKSTLNALKECKKLGANHIGVDMNLYYDYNWIATKNEMNIEISSYAEYEPFDYLVLPIDHQYPLGNNYFLLQKNNDLFIFKRQ